MIVALLAASSAAIGSVLPAILVGMVAGYGLRAVLQKKCPHCQRYIPKKATVCPRCSEDVSAPERSDTSP